MLHRTVCQYFHSSKTILLPSSGLLSSLFAASTRTNMRIRRMASTMFGAFAFDAPAWTVTPPRMTEPTCILLTRTAGLFSRNTSTSTSLCPRDLRLRSLSCSARTLRALECPASFLHDSSYVLVMLLAKHPTDTNHWMLTEPLRSSQCFVPLGSMLSIHRYASDAPMESIQGTFPTRLDAVLEWIAGLLFGPCLFSILHSGG